MKYNLDQIRFEALQVAEEHEHRRRKYKLDETAHGTIRVPARMVVELIEERKRLQADLDAARAMIRTQPNCDGDAFSFENMIKAVESIPLAPGSKTYTVGLDESDEITESEIEWLRNRAGVCGFFVAGIDVTTATGEDLDRAGDRIGIERDGTPDSVYRGKLIDFVKRCIELGVTP